MGSMCTVNHYERIMIENGNNFAKYFIISKSEYVIYQKRDDIKVRIAKLFFDV
jgi:hypothetical protein